jgi:hypothetical protein
MRGFTSALIPLNKDGSWWVDVRRRSVCAKAQKGCGTAGSKSVTPSGAFEHLGSRFDNVLDHSIDGEGRKRFAHGALHHRNLVAESL